MTWLQSLILGTVQGLTEFIPISSSGHLLLVPWLMGWEDSGLTFDVSLHLGTLFAILFYYKQEWIEITKAFFKYGFKGKTVDQKMPIYLLWATIPGAIVGMLLEKKAETVFRSPTLVAAMMALVGVLIWAIDRYSKKERSFSQITLKDALIIGAAQCLALVPGTSRSGITMMAGRACGFNRPTAAKFSFMMAMPITLGACVFKLRHLSELDIHFVIGVTSSLVFGFLAIGGMIKFLQKRSFNVFAAYRIVVGAIIFALIYLKK